MPGSTPSDPPSDSENFLAVPLADVSAEEGNKTLIVCSILVISLKTTMKKSGYDVRNIADWRTHFMLAWRKILFVSPARDKHCFVLSLFHFYL